MRCSNSHGSYLVFEEFSGSGQRGFIILPEGKNKWGWSSFVEVLQFLLSPFSSVKLTPPEAVAVNLPSLEIQEAPGCWS